MADYPTDSWLTRRPIDRGICLYVNKCIYLSIYYICTIASLFYWTRKKIYIFCIKNNSPCPLSWSWLTAGLVLNICKQRMKRKQCPSVQVNKSWLIGGEGGGGMEVGKSVNLPRSTFFRKMRIRKHSER